MYMDVRENLFFAREARVTILNVSVIAISLYVCSFKVIFHKTFLKL